jgi:flavin reductase (DIM6/NTAB) family NADH-FMN oxidoreductase RutF
MHFDIANLDSTAVYKLLTGLVVPRPIAWVTTLNPDLTVNAAPFSFFNAIGSEPPLIVLGIGNHPDRPKDTAVNIELTQEFVVNLVPESLAQAMSDSAANYPRNVSEVDQLQLATVPSQKIKPPRLRDCPACLECTLERTLQIGENRIVFGNVVSASVRDDCVADPIKLHIASDQMKLIGRMGGPGGYTTTRGLFQIERKK